MVADYLQDLTGADEEFARLEALQQRVQSEVRGFRGGDRAPRDEVHERAVP